MEPKARFALDHNFPAPVLAAFAELMPEVQLVPVTDIDASFADLDDWELFVALHRHPSAWDGLITNDRSLLGLPKEMTVLSQTTLTLIVASGQGHNPIRAVGVLLCHLSHICHHTKKDRAQVWELSVAQKDYKEPHDFLERIASRQDTTIEKLVETNKLPSRELTRKHRSGRSSRAPLTAAFTAALDLLGLLQSMTSLRAILPGISGAILFTVSRSAGDSFTPGASARS